MPGMKTTQQMRDELLLRGRGQFKQWFGNSVVADKTGRPKPVYHSTDQQFSVFKTDGLGFHVGTKGQARDIGGFRMIKAYASLQNPLRMPDMGERWDSAPRMTDALLDQGTLTDEEGAAITGQPRERQLQALKDLLISKGHDGIVYENEHEGRGGDSYLLFHPHQIKATTNKAPTMSPDIHMAAGGSVQQMRDELLLKGLSGGGEVKAPVTPSGFYSPLEEAALRIQRKTGNAQAFMNDLKTVPKEHLQHAGVDRLLTSRPTITREELQQHVARAAPKVEVKVLSRDGKPNNDEWEPDDGRIGNTRYGQYTLPGGQNYREVLLTLPQQKPRMNYRVYAQGPVDQLPEVVDFDSREKAEAELARRRAAQPRLEHGMMEFEKLPRDGGIATYRSNHWDEPNVLAHFRINDRTDKDGKKVLFVEEIQSDWGQQGKKEGFQEKSGSAEKAYREYEAGLNARFEAMLRNDLGAEIKDPVRLDRLVKAYMDKTDAGARASTLQEKPTFNEYSRAWNDELRKNAEKVPTAPFVTKTNDWVNLALKHILKMAAEEGHDRVAFVKGEQAAERFGLDKHFSRVAARPTPTGGYQLQTILKDGSREDSIDVPPNKLHEYVGQDLADKIHTQGGGVFEGGDLKMPQMGVRKFYDELVPAQAHALVKKFGGQMGTVGVQFPPASALDPQRTSLRETVEHPGFDITPEMRQAILKPMSYKVGGAVPAMDAMRLQVWDKRRGR